MYWSCLFTLFNVQLCIGPIYLFYLIYLQLYIGPVYWFYLIFSYVLVLFIHLM